MDKSGIRAALSIQDAPVPVSDSEVATRRKIVDITRETGMPQIGHTVVDQAPPTPNALWITAAGTLE